MDSTKLGLIIFIILVIGWVVGRIIFRSRKYGRWIDFVDALRRYDLKTFEDLGAPTFHFLQFGKKSFTNERLWFEVLRNSGRFHAHPRIRETAEAYRRLAIIELIYISVLLLTALWAYVS